MLGDGITVNNITLSSYIVHSICPFHVKNCVNEHSVYTEMQCVYSVGLLLHEWAGDVTGIISSFEHRQQWNIYRGSRLTSFCPIVIGLL